MKIRSPLTLLILAGLLLNGCGTLEFRLERPTLTPQSQVPTNRGPEPTAAAAPAGTAISPTLFPTAEATPAPAGPDPIAAIDMVDSTQGWATSHPGGGADMRILRTADGGTTWQDVTPGLTRPANGVDRRASVFFRNAEKAWVTYEDQPAGGKPPEGFVWFTADGGKSWSKSQALDFNGIERDYYDPSDLGFVDEQNGWLIAHIKIDMLHDYFAVFTSENGGMTWQRQVDAGKDPQVMACMKTGLTFTDPKVGWLTGDCGGASTGVFLYRTEDGGTTWMPVSLTAPGSQADVYTSPDSVCAAEKLILHTAPAAYLPVRCGSRATGQVRRWIYTYQEPDLSWAIRDTPEGFGSFGFIDAATGWMLAAKPTDPTHFTLFRTEDGAQTWVSIADLDWNGRPDFVDAQSGWAIAQTAGGAALMRTLDGGATWQRLEPRIVESAAPPSPDSGQGLTIQYDSSLVSGTTVQKFPAAADASAPYWQVLPQHTQITLNGYPAANPLQKPQIFLYPVEEFKAVNETAGKVIAGLQGLLENGPGGQAHLSLPAEQSAPFLPLGNGQQSIHARLKGFAFRNGQGIGYLTQLDQSYAPIRNSALMYTYQGLTSDGKYYVAAVLPVTLASLPDKDTPPAGVKPGDYYAEMTRQLESEAPSSFVPSLDQLDAMLASIEVKE